MTDGQGGGFARNTRTVSVQHRGKVMNTTPDRNSPLLCGLVRWGVFARPAPRGHGHGEKPASTQVFGSPRPFNVVRIVGTRRANPCIQLRGSIPRMGVHRGPR